jgi:integrase
MGLYKKGKVWWFIKQYKGRRIEESLGTSQKKLAERRYAEKLPSILDGTYILKQRVIPKIREVINRYMREVSPLQKSHERNLEVASHWYDMLGDRLVPEVTTSLLSAFKAKRLSGEIVYGKGKGRRAGASTIKRELGFLRHIFNIAMNEWEDDWDEYFKDHPLNPVKKVIRGLKDPERIRYVSPDEAQRLRLTLPDWLRPIVIVAAGTGLRQGNVVNLLVSEVDLSQDLINLPGSKMKNGRPISVRMTSDVRNMLANAIKQRRVFSPYVFADESGRPFDKKAVSMSFRRACQRAGIKDLRFHDLRHDFATLLINRGASLYQLQRILSHSDPRMTQRYAHLLPENLNVVKLIEGHGITTILRQSG